MIKLMILTTLMLPVQYRDDDYMDRLRLQQQQDQLRWEQERMRNEMQNQIERERIQQQNRMEELRIQQERMRQRMRDIGD